MDDEQQLNNSIDIIRDILSPIFSFSKTLKIKEKPKSKN